MSLMSAELLQRIAGFIRQQCLVDPDDLVVVGVSGGIDSIVLLHVLATLDFRLLAAHVNYGLRGEAADADEEFVRQLCARQNVALMTARYDTKSVAQREGTSIQDAARLLRYRFFGEVAAAEGAHAVAVGHHSDDQAETLLLNLFRGTGIDGLSGMAPVRTLAPGSATLLVRPLLAERRQTIEAYARAHSLNWREDSSNAGDDYLRNALRLRILPAVEELFGGDVSERLARTAEVVRAYASEVLTPELEERFAACAHRDQERAALNVSRLRTLPPRWQTRMILEVLRRWFPDAPRTAAAAEAIVQLSDAQVGRKVGFAALEVWRERDHLVFVPHTQGGNEGAVMIPASGGAYAVPHGMVRLEQTGLPADLDHGSPFSVTVDADKLGDEIRFRTWRPGDVIRPLGMEGHRKNVSDVLTDARVAAHRRKQVLVMESDGVVAWVVGVRLSHEVRVTEQTVRFITLTYLPRDPDY